LKESTIHKNLLLGLARNNFQICLDEVQFHINNNACQKSDGNMAKKDKKSFEENITELESIVSNLEQGDVELENVLAQFEEGLKIYKTCKTMLNEAEKKVKVLTDDLKEEDL
jgi:exodeoxyribonuclease VII small subunit